MYMGKPVLFLFLLSASLTDLKYRRITNLHNLFFLIPGIIFCFLDRGVTGLMDGILTALLIFTFLYMFYGAGCLGAGDIKFIMTVAVYTGHKVLLNSLIPIGVFSVITAAGFAVYEGGSKKLMIPMAVPVSMGILYGMFFPAESLWFT